MIDTKTKQGCQRLNCLELI